MSRVTAQVGDRTGRALLHRGRTKQSNFGINGAARSEDRGEMSGQQRRDILLTPDEARLVPLLRAPGTRVRLQIMGDLAQRGSCLIYEVGSCAPLAQATVSEHFKMLHETGIVCSKPEGRATRHRLNTERVRWFQEQIEAWLPGCGDRPATAPIHLRSVGSLPIPPACSH